MFNIPLPTQSLSFIEFAALTPPLSDALCVVLQRDYKVDDTPHRLVWSPHVGVEEGEECLVVSHGSDVDVIDVRAVIATVPSGMKIASKKLEKGITTLPAVHSLVSSHSKMSNYVCSSGPSYPPPPWLGCNRLVPVP